MSPDGAGYPGWSCARLGYAKSTEGIAVFSSLSHLPPVTVHSPQARLLRSIFLRTVFHVPVVRKESGQRVTIRLNIS